MVNLQKHLQKIGPHLHKHLSLLGSSKSCNINIYNYQS
jgi:hypothetical protein